MRFSPFGSPSIGNCFHTQDDGAPTGGDNASQQQAEQPAAAAVEQTQSATEATGEQPAADATAKAADEQA